MVKLKICGLTNPDDYHNVVNLEVDFIGFIFYKFSSRYVYPNAVREIIHKGKKGDFLKIGVFVNEEISVVQNIFQYCDLDLVQLHGDESVDYCKELSLPYWKVFRIGNDQKEMSEYLKYDCDTILLDTFLKDSYGGTGWEIDLTKVHELICSSKKVIIAGGVSINNIERICRAKPYGVDVNSMVEDTPGKKNIIKIQTLYEKLKRLNRENSDESK